jgi:hypothetical protein
VSLHRKNEEPLYNIIARACGVTTRLLTVKEAAGYLRCGVSTLNKLRVSGGGPRYVKMLGRVTYAEADLERHIPDSDASNARGVVYFIECGDVIKIGYTAKIIRNRLSELGTATPYPLAVLATIPGTLRTESRLHRKFAPARYKSEWFR